VTFAFLAFALVAAVNPCRLRLTLPERRAAVALGALLALGSVAAITAVGGALLDALDVSPESFRLGAALVLALEGARGVLLSRPGREPELAGLGAALVPVAFPLLLSPGVVALAIAAGGDDVEAEALGALALALAVTLAVTLVPRGERADALLAAGGRLLAGLEVAAGVALAVGAIRDV
jgi:small neutral amino acid transporter SnatA (MarC family)